MQLLVLHQLQSRDAFCQEHQGYLDSLRELYIDPKILNITTLRMVDILRPSKIVYYPSTTRLLYRSFLSKNELCRSVEYGHIIWNDGECFVSKKSLH